MSALTTRAAVLREPGQWWEVAELALDPPRDNEVQIRFMASGLCHSDEHIRAGAAPFRFPMVGGHEGAGVVEAVGPKVTRVQAGDHVVTTFVPICGRCRYCSTGHQSLCVAGVNIATGCLDDGTFRFHDGDQDLGGMCILGTFSQRAVVSELSCVKIDDDLPFEVAALVGCGVTTGWSTAVHAAGVRPGDTVVVFGVGGVGINAVQGAWHAGAKHVVAVDPVEFKLDTAQTLGATHAASDAAAARELVAGLTGGQLADHALITVGELNAEVVTQAFGIVGKLGQVTMTSVGRFGDMSVHLPGGAFLGAEKRLRGTLFGSSNPLHDIPKLLGLYRVGRLKLDELITQRYRLDQINDGYHDMMDGKNIRGVIIHEHA